MFWFLLLVVDITLDAFVLMMEKGATTLKVNFIKAIEHSAIFASVSSFMYMLGYISTDLIFDGPLTFVHRYLAIILFIVIGLKSLIVINLRSQFVEKLNHELNAKKSFKDALISGLDCLIVGAGASYFAIPYLHQLAIIFLVTLVVLYIALYVGYNYGAAYQKTMRYICAFVYLVLSVLIIINLV